jgi:hypothetical protein
MTLSPKMTLSSKNMTRYALAIALLALIGWMSSNMLTHSVNRSTMVGTIEVTPLN